MEIGVDVMINISKITIKILFMLLIMQFIYMPVSQAVSTSWGDIFESGDEFLELGKEESEEDNPTINNGDLKEIITAVYNLLFSLGIVMSVIIGAVIGIKLMFGGIEEKAKTKEQIVPYVLGCVVIFGAFGIWKIAIILLSTI